MVLKVYRFRSVLSYLRSMELTDVNIDAIVALAEQKQAEWCLVPKITVLSTVRYSRISSVECYVL